MVTKSILTAVVMLVLAGTAAAQPVEAMRPEPGGLIDQVMYTDPAIESVVIETLWSPRLIELWLAAMERPEADLRWSAAEAFGLAGQQGMPGTDAAVERLKQMVRADPSTDVQYAAAQALVRLDEQSAAPTLLAANMAWPGSSMAALTDPALARWRHTPAFDVWRSRAQLREPVALARSAIASLGQAQVASARDLLIEIATGSQEHPTLRVTAAQALHAMDAAGLASAAGELLTGTPVDQIVAAYLLSASPTSTEVSPLQDLVRQGDAVAASVASQGLLALGPERVLAIAPTLAGHADPNVRLTLVEAARTAPSGAAIQRLADRLDDSSHAVRTAAREALAELGAQAPWVGAVREQLQRVLADSGWRGLEQAALAAALLDIEPAAARLIELLDHDRPEVSLAAAEGLRRLAVEQTFPRLLEHAQKLTDEAKSLAREADAAAQQEMAETGPPQAKTPPADFEQVSPIASVAQDTAQLFQLFGQVEYEPAATLLRQYISKSSPYGGEARAAAIYALGRIYQGSGDAQLGRQLAQRTADMDSQFPEDDSVRRTAAVAAGRIGAAEVESTLARVFDREGISDVGLASQWAVARLRGEEPPATPIIRAPSRGWFLEPIR